MRRPPLGQLRMAGAPFGGAIPLPQRVIAAVVRLAEAANRTICAHVNAVSAAQVMEGKRDRRPVGINGRPGQQGVETGPP